MLFGTQIGFSITKPEKTKIMNLPERYKNLKRKSNEFLLKGLINEYIRILKELTRIEKQLQYSLQWN